MERQCVGVVVYLHIPIILTDNFANAFQSETMLIAMGDTYSRNAMFCCERICPTGVNDCQNRKWSFSFFACTDFNK